MMDFNDMFMNLSSQWNYTSDVLVVNAPGACVFHVCAEVCLSVLAFAYVCQCMRGVRGGQGAGVCYYKIAHPCY